MSDSKNPDFIDRHIYIRKDQLKQLQLEAYHNQRTFQGQLRYVIDSYYDNNSNGDAYGVKPPGDEAKIELDP